MTHALFPNRLTPAEPAPSELRIGTIGAGSIVNGAHIPQYTQAGYRIVGCADINAEAAEATKERWNLAFSTTDYRDLLERPDIDVVVVAVRAEGRGDIVRDAAAAEKHILLEKPFAHSYADAAAMVEVAEQAGIKLAVNQNRRWMPLHYATRRLLDEGSIGQPFLGVYQGRSNQEYLVGSWYEQHRHFLLIEFCVHQIDLLIYWLGEPESVYASTSQSPEQRFAQDMVATVTFNYSDHRRAQLIVNDVAYLGGGSGYQESDRFAIDGSTGYIEKIDEVTLGLTSKQTEGASVRKELDSPRASNSFACSMGDLLAAIAGDREPQVSGRQNLATMRTVFAACQSADERRVVSLSEVAEGVRT
jgi:predicted dehydrogenase